MTPAENMYISMKCSVCTISYTVINIDKKKKGREKDWKMSSTINMTEEEFYKEVYDYGTL